MNIDTYKLTSMEEPSDEMLSQLMREAAEEAAKKKTEATKRFFNQLKSDAQKIALEIEKGRKEYKAGKRRIAEGPRRY